MSILPVVKQLAAEWQSLNSDDHAMIEADYPDLVRLLDDMGRVVQALGSREASAPPAGFWIDKMTFQSIQGLNAYRANGRLPPEQILSIETLPSERGGGFRVWYYAPTATDGTHVSEEQGQ